MKYFKVTCLCADGSVDEIDREIELRGLIEAATRLQAFNKTREEILRTLREMHVGWEGARDSWSMAGGWCGLAAGIGEHDRNYAICLLFGGGATSIKSVFAAIERRIPVLLIRGSRGAADLIADAVRIFESEDSDDDEGSAGASGRSMDKSAVSNMLLVKKFVMFMVQLKDRALEKDAGNNYAWPPAHVSAEAPGDSLESLDEWRSRCLSWKDWKRRGGEWVHGRFSAGVWVEDDARRTLEPGTAEHVAHTIQLGVSLLAVYGVELPPAFRQADTLRLLCEMFDCISSDVCVVYDVMARAGSELSSSDAFKEAALLCVLRALESEARFKTLGNFFRWWRECGAGFQQGRADTTHQPESDAVGVLDKVKSQIEISKQLEFDVLKIAIEWNDQKTVQAVLDGYEEELVGWERIIDDGKADAIDSSVLNKCLHLAMVHENCDVVDILLDRKADLTLYEHGGTGVWKDVLVTACQAAESQYLHRLLQRAWAESGAATGGTVECDIKPIEARAGLSEDQGAAEILNVPGKHKTSLLFNRFNVKDIADDIQAKAIIMKALAALLTDEKHEAEGFHFESSSTYLQLTLCALLTGRTKLAHLLLGRDFTTNATPLYQNALLACLLCRRLAALPAVIRFHHLKETFSHASDAYEARASAILRAAHGRNATGCQRAFEQPIAQRPAWSAIDLVFKADCRSLVSDCSELCEEVVQRRFSGDGSSALSLSRYTHVMSKLLGESSVTSANEPKLLALSTSLKVILSVAMDAAGAYMSSQVLILVLPASCWLTFHITGSVLLMSAVLSKIVLPYGSLIPISTIVCVVCLCRNEDGDDPSPEDDTEQAGTESSLLPVDLYLLDVAAHVLHACLFTAFFLTTSANTAYVLEIAVASLFAADLSGDILLAGVSRKTTSIAQVFYEGLRDFASDLW